MPTRDASKAKIYRKRFYESHKQQVIQEVAERRKLFKLFTTAYKENHPCVDCGKFYPACVLDFDHILDNKIHNVSKLTTLGSWDKLISEIEKCELVCANCHRIRTFLRL